MTQNGIVQALTILGGLSGLAAILNAFWSRKKAPADAAAVLTTAASGLVAGLQSRIDELERRQRKQEALNREHRKWDALVVTHLKQVGIVIPEPPNLNADL